MTIRTLYDLKADCMILNLNYAVDHSISLSVKRRQWLNMLWQVRRMASKMDVNLSVIDLKKNMNRPSSNAKLKTTDAQELERINFAMRDGGIGINFVTNQNGFKLKLISNEISKFYELLLLQAERASWDPEAALLRLQAGALATKAIQKASKPT